MAEDINVPSEQEVWQDTIDTQQQEMVIELARWWNQQQELDPTNPRFRFLSASYGAVACYAELLKEAKLKDGKPTKEYNEYVFERRSYNTGYAWNELVELGLISVQVSETTGDTYFVYTVTVL